MLYKFIACTYLFLLFSCGFYSSPYESSYKGSPEIKEEKSNTSDDIQIGMASWYGIEEHKNRAASGETFDKNELTAAHKTLPMDTIVRVTNLENGRDVIVRINDRGPFVKGRIIDLSYAAAREVDMLGPGIAKVKVEVISSLTRDTSYFKPKYIVQVGSFKYKENAIKLKDKLKENFEGVRIQEYLLNREKYYRVRIGKFETRNKAEQVYKKLKKLGYKPAIKIE